MKFLYNTFILSAILLCVSCKQDTTVDKKIRISPEKPSVYYFIRHAEKDTTNPEQKDPQLTEEGEARAEKWKQIFSDTRFDAIYSSDFARTKATAKPTAASKSLDIKIYDHKDLNSKKFQEDTQSKKVLVVGHTNTAPYFANAVLGKDHFKEDIPDTIHGMLYIVQVNPNDKNSLQILNLE